MIFTSLFVIGFLKPTATQAQEDTLNNVLYRFNERQSFTRQTIDSVNVALSTKMYYSLPGIERIFRIALEESAKLNHQEGLANLHLNFGVYLLNKGKYEMAITELLEGLKLFDLLKISTKSAEVMNQLARVYIILSDIQPSENTSVSNKLPGLYLKSNDLDRAETYCRNSIKINILENNKNMLASNYNNMGVIKQKKIELDSAESYFMKAKSIYEALGEKESIANIYNNLGLVFEFKGLFAEEMSSYLQALKIYEEIGYKQGIAVGNNNIAMVNFTNGDCKEGLVYAKKAYAIANSLNDIPIKKDALYTLYTLYDCLSDCEMKSFYYSRYNEVKDSLFNIESKKILEDVNAQYETEKKENEIKLLNKDKEIDKTIKNALYLGILLALMLVFVVYRNYRSKQKANLVLASQNVIIENERKKSDELLLNILPEETARELKENGQAEARLFETVTVMFTDFKDFTKISEQMDAKALVMEINVIFKKFDEIMIKHKVEKIKTIGDAYMAVGGLPVATPTHAEDVMKAAQEIIAYIESHKEERIKAGLPYFNIRIGIHSGPVVAGVVGIKKFTYDIWGDTVNVASRMESGSEAGRINVSGTTYELLKDKYTFVYRGKIAAKNKGEIDMYFLSNEAS